MSDNVKHVIFLVFVAGGAALAALAKADPSLQWLGGIVAVVSALGNALTPKLGGGE